MGNSSSNNNINNNSNNKQQRTSQNKSGAKLQYARQFAPTKAREKQEKSIQIGHNTTTTASTTIIINNNNNSKSQSKSFSPSSSNLPLSDNNILFKNHKNSKKSAITTATTTATTAAATATKPIPSSRPPREYNTSNLSSSPPIFNEKEKIYLDSNSNNNTNGNNNNNNNNNNGNITVDSVDDNNGNNDNGGTESGNDNEKDEPPETLLLCKNTSESDHQLFQEHGIETFEKIPSIHNDKIVNNYENNFTPSLIKWGYVELTKKQLGEDQAAFLTWTHKHDGFTHAWAIFDGHGGYETALYCAQHFLNYVKKYHISRAHVKDWKLLMKEIFTNFDAFIGSLNIRGGCTVILALLVKNKLIVANAGDARAIMSQHNGKKACQLSLDHSPMNDYERLAKIAKKQDKIISKYFRINDKNETVKQIQLLPTEEIKKTPFIFHEGEKSRLLATIGVARGFGDFNLSVFGLRNIQIKPFLSSEPFVTITELNEENIDSTDLLIIACDGIFDVMNNEEVIAKTRNEIWLSSSSSSSSSQNDNKNKSLLKNLEWENLDNACFKLGKTAYSRGTMDDISVFAIPLFQYLHNNMSFLS